MKEEHDLALGAQRGSKPQDATQSFIQGLYTGISIRARLSQLKSRVLYFIAIVQLITDVDKFVRERCEICILFEVAAKA